jgi:hypothetical protein
MNHFQGNTNSASPSQDVRPESNWPELLHSRRTDQWLSGLRKTLLGVESYGWEYTAIFDLIDGNAEVND